jgi:hypothetical protein
MPAKTDSGNFSDAHGNSLSLSEKRPSVLGSAGGRFCFRRNFIALLFAALAVKG